MRSVNVIIAFVLQSCSAFVLPATNRGPAFISRDESSKYDDRQGHPSFRQQRSSVANVQTMGLFGLGLPEIAIIVLVGAFLVGPEQLGNLAGQVKGELDDLPDELKKIPEEFKKGIEEGEESMRSKRAKEMEPAPAESEETSK